MLSIYENSKLYSLPQYEIKALKHQENITLPFLILIKSNVEINNEIVEMLDKIVGALKLETNEAEFLVFTNKLMLMDLVSKYQAEKVLVFGAEAEDLNLNMILNPFKVYEINKLKLLLVNNIIDVYGNQNIKAKLWNLLKTMF